MIAKMQYHKSNRPAVVISFVDNGVVVGNAVTRNQCGGAMPDDIQDALLNVPELAGVELWQVLEHAVTVLHDADPNRVYHFVV